MQPKVHYGFSAFLGFTLFGKLSSMFLFHRAGLMAFFKCSCLGEFFTILIDQGVIHAC